MPTETMTAEQYRRPGRTRLEDRLLALVRAAGLPEPVRELQFAKSIGRRWRFDFAWPEQRVAVEVDGGIFVAGRHSRGAGQLADMEKQAAAVLLGWRVLRVAAPHFRSGQAVEWIRAALGMEAAA